MSQLRSAVALAVIASLVAACSRDDPAPQVAAQPPAPAAPPPAPVGYACESGKAVTVQYPDTSTAQVTYLNQSYILRTAPVASGVRYSGSGVEWATVTQNGQEAATLSRLGPNGDVGAAVLERCRRPARSDGAPINGAPINGAPINGALGPPTSGRVPTDGLPCRSAQLKLSSEGGDAGMGNRVAVIGVQNTGAEVCTLTGYPTVTLLDSVGRTLTAVRSERNPGNYFRSGTAPKPVSLAPGAKGYFDLAWNVVPDESQGQTVCPSAATVRVAAPGDTAIVSLGQAFTPCGGRVRVSPIRPTASDDPAAT